jgi:hypothetical protein
MGCPCLEGSGDYRDVAEEKIGPITQNGLVSVFITKIFRYNRIFAASMAAAMRIRGD